MKRTKDIIQQKQLELEALQNLSNNSLKIVTSTIDNLTSINDSIDQTIDEIEQAKNQLENTRQGLYDQRRYNSNIVKKFKTLIEDDKEN